MRELYHHTNTYEERTIAWYNALDIGFPFHIAKMVYMKNSIPLKPEVLPNSYQITYQVSGRQSYTVDGKMYIVNAGQVFVSLPKEERSTGGIPFDKSKFYYMIIDLDHFAPGTIGFTKEETEEIRTRFRTLFTANHLLTLDSQATKYFERLITLFTEETPYFTTILRNTLSELFLYLLHPVHLEHTLSDEEFQPVISYIREHICEYVTLDKLAELMDMSKPRFYVRFKEKLFFPPREYIIREKIKYAENLLRTTSLSVTEIALQLGFSSSQYFSNAFKKYTTFSPTIYRKYYGSQ